MSEQVQQIPITLTLEQLKRLLFEPRRLPKSNMPWYDRHYEILNQQLNIWLAVNDRSGLDTARRKGAYSVIVFNQDKVKAEYFWYPYGKARKLAKNNASVEIVNATEELLLQMKQIKELIK